MNVTGYRLDELKDLIVSLGGKKYSAKQIWNWVYSRSVNDFSLMSDLSAGLREKLKENLRFEDIKISQILKSSDGSEKLLLELSDLNVVECVLIPEKRRMTLCVSSQAGCRYGCVFCATGKLGFIRNLTASEIVSQILIASEYSQKRITNVVYMGMGEPFDNYDEVIKSADIISDDSGLAIGKRKITISTFGHIDGIKRYIRDDARYKLAVSLHNPFDSERSSVMPGNKKFGVKGLFEVLKIYSKKSNRKVVFEYVLIKGFNDTESHAKELIRLLEQLPSKLNLIKYHKNHDNKKHRSLSEEEEAVFFNRFKNVNFPVVFRKSRGEDIKAACGQLAAEHLS